MCATPCKISTLTSKIVSERDIIGPVVDMLNLCVKRIMKARGQGSTNNYCEGPDNKYFRSCGPDGLYRNYSSLLL